MGLRGFASAAVFALLLLTSGCLVGSSGPDAAPSESSREEPPAVEADAEPASAPVHTLEIRAWDVSEIADVLSVEDTGVSPTPASIDSFQLGPRETEADPVVLARLNATEGTVLESFRLEVTVDDGLGPAKLVLEIPDWRATEDAEVNVHLELVEVGQATIDHVDGDLPVDVDEESAEPRYGYLEWPAGHRQPLEGLDRIVSVPEPFPRFGHGAEPSFGVDEDVVWRLDGQHIAQGSQVHLDPEPGRHTLTVEDPETGGEADVTFSLNERFRWQGTILAPSGGYRESLAGANEDTYNLSVHDGARTLIARLEPVGNESDVENLDVYALNASGGVIDESTTNDSAEILTLSRGDLAAEDSIRLRVHGQTAAHTEYRLFGTVFYRPW